VSHSWTEPFNELVDTLQLAIDSQESVVFLARLGLVNNQPWPKGNDYTSEVQRSNAILGLRRSEKLIIIADRNFGFLRCRQCGHEIWEAREGFLPTFLIPNQDTDLEKLKTLVDPTNFPEQKPESLERSLERSTKPEILEARTAARLSRNGFIERRILCYALALQEATESKYFNMDTFRQLHAEYERIVAVKEAMQICNEKIDAARQTFKNKEIELQRLKQTVESERKTHTREFEEGQKLLEEGHRSNQHAQEKCKILQATISDLDQQLKDTDEELAQLEAREKRVNVRTKELKQKVEESRRIADEEERLADEATFCAGEFQAA